MTEQQESDIVNDEFDDLIDPEQIHEKPDWFDEEAYCRANPDVRDSISANVFPSAYHHYVLHGRQERRPLYGTSMERRNCLVRSGRTVSEKQDTGGFRASVDRVIVSPKGGILVIGWVDDVLIPVETVKVSSEGWYITLTSSRGARIRRPDVEAALNAVGTHSFGFFSFAFTGEPLGTMTVCKVAISLADERQVTFDVPVQRLDELELRETMLTFVTEADLSGDLQVEYRRMLNRPLGSAIVQSLSPQSALREIDENASKELPTKTDKQSGAMPYNHRSNLAGTSIAAPLINPVVSVDVSQKVALAKSHIATRSGQPLVDKNQGGPESSELRLAARLPTPSSASELSSLLTLKDEQLSSLKELASRRSSDLTALTLHVQKIDQELEKLRSQTLALSKELNDSHKKALQLQDAVVSLQNQKDRLICTHSANRLEFTAKLRTFEYERRLLYNFVNVLTSDKQIQDFAIATGLFDPEWYASTYSPTSIGVGEAFKHYMTEGYSCGYDPSSSFSSIGYSKNNPDLDLTKFNPLHHYIRTGMSEGRYDPEKAKRPIVRVIMMQRNEQDLLYPWVLYHGARFGFRNLWIVDNGSDQATQERLSVVQSFGVNVDFTHSSRDDFKNKGEIIAEIVQKMDESDPADFYFPLDCDEFVGVEPKENQFSFELDDICHELLSHVGTQSAMNVRVYLDNHPSLPGYFKRVGGQRKAFFAKGTCAGLDHGFNNPRVRAGGTRKDSRIIYTHFHYKPFTTLQAHARQRLENFTNDFSEKALRQYISEKRPGFQSARYIIINEKQYLTQIDKSLFKPVDALVRAFEVLGIPVPFAKSELASS